MRTDLKRRIDQVEAGFSPPTVMGIWAHQDGTPTYHRLNGLYLDLERWFKTGELPKKVEFIGVIAMPEPERLWKPEPERRQPWEFAATEEQLQADWRPFPTLHPSTLKQFRRMLEQSYYCFVDGQLRGMNGPLPPKEQRRELYPHG